MINRQTFSLDHIRFLQQKYKTDPGLLERVLYAFGLLEALLQTDLQFIFKGGSSMMLLLEHPVRLSTDIDIIVKPDTDMDMYVNKAGKVFPFIRKEEQIRKGRNNLQKRHFKFYYFSPVHQSEFYILLDVVFMNSPYEQIIHKPVTNDLLIMNQPVFFVDIPSCECLLADKLTAFAPHTTGILLGTDKDLEIAKQFFDVIELMELMQDQNTLRRTYLSAVNEELSFRGLELNYRDVLIDTIRACVSIISRGAFDSGDYKDYLKGIRSLYDHLITIKFSPETAAEKACYVMCLAASILSDTEYPTELSINEYTDRKLVLNHYKKLGYIRKRSLKAYAYLVEATEKLSRTDEFNKT